MFNIFKKKDEVVCPKIKGGRYLADINDVPDPVNEQTPQLVRIMNKFKEIIDDPSDWKMVTNSYDERVCVNSDGFKISIIHHNYDGKNRYSYISFHSPTNDYVFDSITILNSHVIWNPYKLKQTQESIIIDKCFSIFEKIEKERKQKKDDELRRKFYKQT